VELLAALIERAGSLTQVALGSLTGIVATSALVAAGVMPPHHVPPPSPGPLALVRCPGSGPVIAVAQPGEQMLVTGRSADGAWFRIYVPGPIAGEGWVRSGSIELLADGSALPVGSCGDVAAATTIPATPTPTPTLEPATPIATPQSRIATPSPTTVAPTASAAATPNVGPVFSAQPAASRATIAFRPLGTGNCPTAASITAAATDSDGVAQVQLWVKKPGAASFARLSHDFVRAGTKWSNSIDAAKDGVTVAGTLSFYAVAIDAKGASTTSKAKSITVVRCDTEASINGGIDFDLNSQGQYEIFCELRWLFVVADGDGVTGVTLTYVDPPGSAARSITLNRVAGTVGSWTGRSIVVPHGVSTVAWTVRSTDRFGGTTTLSRTDVVHYQCVT
jgi:hypothetical protein